MGNVQSEVPPPKKNFLLVERLIATNCDFLPDSAEDKNILIGVCGTSKDELNPLANQAIRLCNNTHRLLNFQEGNSTLTYEFEKNVTLNIMRSENKIMYNIKTPDINVTREIHPSVVKLYKPIGVASVELDTIKKLYANLSLQ